MQAIWAKIMSIIMAILAFFGLVKPAPEVTPGDGCKAEGQVVTVWLDANPTTGYGWTASVDGDCVTLTRDEYVAMQTEPNVAGAGGTQYYDFTAAKPGTAGSVESGMAELVILTSFLRIAQHRIGFRCFLKFCLRLRISLIGIRMVFFCQCTVGFFQVFLRCVLGDAQYLIIISFCFRHKALYSFF